MHENSIKKYIYSILSSAHAECRVMFAWVGSSFVDSSSPPLTEKNKEYFPYKKACHKLKYLAHYIFGKSMTLNTY